MDKNLHCSFLDHNDPYLRIGPFLSERKLKNPEMMIIHNFANDENARKIISDARGKLSVTPFFSGGSSSRGNFIQGSSTLHKVNKAFLTLHISVSQKRTSKMVYLRKNLNPQIAKRIQLITRFDLSKSKFGSENFKVQNYGLGGTFQSHWDSIGNISSK